MDPRTGACRYVGKANNPRKRLAVHLAEAKRPKTHRHNWIQSLLRVGLRPEVKILAEVPETQWVFWEREYIRVFKAAGFDLTNGTDGGEGSHNPSQEQRAKQRAAMLNRPKAPFTAAHREAIRISRIGTRASNETRLKMSAGRGGAKNSFFGKKHSAESLAKMSASHTGKKFPRSPEYCAGLSQRKKAWWAAKKSK